MNRHPDFGHVVTYLPESVVQEDPRTGAGALTGMATWGSTAALRGFAATTGTPTWTGTPKFAG